MQFAKQFLISLIVIVLGLIVWLKFIPGAASQFASVGVPAGLIALIAGDDDDAAGAKAGGGEGRRGPGAFGAFGGAASVVAPPVTTGRANDRLMAIGNGAASRSVSVTPNEAGKLSEVLVKAGDRVEAGDILARMDNREQEIALQRAALDEQAAQQKLERYTNLKGNLSRVELDDAAAAAQTARLAKSAAQLALDNRDIVAPISGIAGIVDVNPGDNLTASSVVVTIDDRSSLLVEFWAPERFADVMTPETPVVARAIARPGVEYAGVIEAVDSRIDETSRTFRVRARIPNDKDELRAGMSFKVELRFEGDEFVAVNPVSIQWDSKGSYVWRVADGKAVRTSVHIIQRNPENVLVEGELSAGDRVVSEGVQRVREGGAVKILGEDQGKMPQGASDGASS